jgi:hypothetical protein
MSRTRRKHEHLPFKFEKVIETIAKKKVPPQKTSKNKPKKKKTGEENP